MAKVEVKFTGFSSAANPPYVDAAPGDVKKVDAEWVPALVDGGIAEPVSKAEAKKAGVE